MSEFDPLCANCGKGQSAHSAQPEGEPGPAFTEPDEHGHKWLIIDSRRWVLTCPSES
jgi:hypothetical protein